MNREDAARAAVDIVTKKLVDEGKLIEAGFAALCVVAYSPDMDAAQRQGMREVYFAGAQHVWASIMSMLDPGVQETPDDMRRMDMIEKELDQFIKDFKQRHLQAAGNA